MGFPKGAGGPPRDGLNPTEHGRNLATPAERAGVNNINDLD
jgi:hypothetical protein